jgi:hypothetical protein
LDIGPARTPLTGFRSESCAVLTSIEAGANDFMIIPSFMPERPCGLASDEVAIESYVAKLPLIEHN